MSKEYTLTLKVDSKIASIMDGEDYEGLESICGVNDVYCKMKIIKESNSITSTSAIQLHGSLWGLTHAFGFLVARVKIAQKQVLVQDSNEVRISHLQTKLELLTDNFEKKLERLDTERRKLANKYGEVAIPIMNDISSESESESESTPFGILSRIGMRKVSKTIKKRQSNQKSGISSETMRTMLQVFVDGVQLVPPEIAIPIEKFRSSFLLFLKKRNKCWELLRPTNGFTQSLMHHLKTLYKDILFLKDGHAMVAVAISFPK